MPWVVKIGGSLYGSRYLKEWLDILDGCRTHQLVIVPGGGPYADQVRITDQRFNLNPTLAHNMSVLGMQQYGYLMASLCPGLHLANSRKQIQYCLDNEKVAIWEPYPMVSRQCALEKNWEVTADSLAAWLADHLGIEQLLLVKSAPVTLSKASVHELQKLGCVDSVLPKLLADTKVSAHFMHKSKAKEFVRLINVC